MLYTNNSDFVVQQRYEALHRLNFKTSCPSLFCLEPHHRQRISKNRKEGTLNTPTISDAPPA